MSERQVSEPMSQASGRRGRGGPRLRARLVITFAVVAALSSVAVAATSYALVRRATLGRERTTAVRESRRSLEEAADRLPASPRRAEVQDLSAGLRARGGFEVVALTGDGGFETTSFSLSAASVPAALRGPVAAGRVAATRQDVAGRPFVVVGGRVLPQGPSFFFFYPLTEAVADLHLLGSVLAGVSGVLVLVSTLVGTAAARRFLRPIRRARRAVHELEAGRLDTRLPAKGRDEFADLARSFNHMAEALERTVGELRQLESSHRRFVSDVSHELRTPLTALTTAADVLEANAAGLNDKGQRAGRLLVLESRRLRTIVEDLMEISRLDAGAASMAWEQVDVAGAVAGAVRARGWDEHVELRAADGVLTYADPRRLDGMVANLVGNALEHGRPPVRLTVSASAEQVLLEVADTGAGIGPEHLPHLFERFYKADPARPRSAGSGLGLAIARENARLHGGDITVTSRPGEGTTFTLVLPRRQAGPGTPGGDGTGPPTAREDRVPTPTGRWRRRRR